MQRKIIAFSLAIMIAAIGFVVTDARKSNTTEYISQGKVDTYGAPNAKENIVEDFAGDQLGAATDIGAVVSDISEIGGAIVDNVGGDIGLGDIIDGAGDLIGGIIGGGNGSGGSGGNTGGTYAPQDTTGGYIVLVPAATDYYTEPDPNLTESSTDVVGETVDFASDVNPYVKPVGELKGGDTGDGVRWVQWIFIYTRYGLRDDGITGVFDEDTMAVVKKFQKEQGLVVDGIVDEEVIDKLEYFYMQTIAPELVTYSPNSNNTTTAIHNVENEGDDDISAAVIVALVSAVWLLAILFIIIVRIMKKNAKNNKTNSKTSSSPKEESKNESADENSKSDKTETKAEDNTENKTENTSNDQ